MTLVELLKYIDDHINTQSGGDKITGAEHNSVLKNVVNALVDIMGTGYGGPIAPTDNPGAQSKPVFFMAVEKGTYTYCGGVEVATSLAFINWDGTNWTVKDVGIPEVDPGAENPSKCYGLASAGDATPSGRVVGDWYVYLGGGTLTWPGGVKDAPGIVFADRIENISGNDTVMWELIPFGGDRHMKGIATPATNIGQLTFVANDYYLVVEAGDYSQFAPITANAVQSAGVIKYNGSEWVYTKNSGSSTGGSSSAPLRAKFSTTTTPANLTAGQFCFDLADQGAIEKIYIHKTDLDSGVNYNYFLQIIKKGAKLIITSATNPSKKLLFGVTIDAALVDNTYLSIAGGVDDLSSDFSADEVVVIDIINDKGSSVTVDAALSATSTNPVANKAVTNRTLSTIKPDADNANKIPVVSADGTVIGYTSFTFDQIVQLAQVDMSDVNVGENKILLAEKLADGSPSFTGAIAQLDKLGPPSLDAILAETNPNWDGDELTHIGNNLNGGIGENSQEYRIGSDFFLCISHNYGTDATNGSATWVRNRGQDSLTPGITHDDAIIAELETETGWSGADFKQIASKSKKGSWYKSAAGGYLYLCIDKNNGWQRHGQPPTEDIEISTASHPTLTTNLAAHDFATNGMYDESSDGTNEAATQAQEWWDTTNNSWYKRNMNGYWAKMN